MIYVARPRTGKNRVVVDIGIHGIVPVWHREYRPCLIDRVLHFFPDQDSSKPAFTLTRLVLKQADEVDALNPDFVSPNNSAETANIKKGRRDSGANGRAECGERVGME